MKTIFIGTKNFDFFSPALLAEMDKVIVASSKQKIPEIVARDSQIIFVDEVYDVDAKTWKLDVEACIASLMTIVRDAPDSKVFCNQEANLAVAEQIRRHFQLYDHLQGRTERFRDKVVMKSFIVNQQLRAPLYMALPPAHQSLNYAELSERLQGSFIIKPSASVGSRGVYKIFSPEDYRIFLAETQEDSCHFEAEEFINGDLYEYDIAMQGGEILYSNVSRYSCPMADLQEGKTLGSIMVERSSELHQRIAAFGERCIRALDATNGCFHMEIFHSASDELVFLEVAARSPGLMTVPAYQRWEGVNMYDLELLIQCDLPAKKHARPQLQHISHPAFFIIYPKKQGKVSALNTPSLPAEVLIDWQVQPGDTVADTTTNIDYAARFFVICDDTASAEKLFNWLTAEFSAVTYQS